MADMVDSAKFQERALLALLMLQVRSAQLQSPDADQAGSSSIEAMLFVAGFTNAEIVKITGTPKSTVTRRLKNAGLI